MNKFLFKAAGLFLLWYLFKTFMYQIDFLTYFNKRSKLLLLDIILFSSQKITAWFGYESFYLGKLLYLSKDSAISINRACMSIDLMGLFAGFIIVYPGNLKSKLWFIPCGIVIIQILNIIRISALAIINDCCEDNMQFYHRYVFKIAIYLFVFMMWLFWIKKFGHFSSGQSGKKNVQEG